MQKPLLVCLVLIVAASVGFGHSQVPTQLWTLAGSHTVSSRDSAEQSTRGINGTIAYNGIPLCPPLGTHALPFFVPPSGSILVRSQSGHETLVTINWQWSVCGYQNGTFQVALHPGKYTVDYTGDKGVCIEPHQLPESVDVEPHGFTQIGIHILTGPGSICVSKGA